jgi:hypothetical protein
LIKIGTSSSASARSIRPRGDEWIVSDILATASAAEDEADRAGGLALTPRSSMELASAIVVTKQTGTASI